jgi:hypothetical protein
MATATLNYSGTSFTHWIVGKYRVTTYPDSDNIFITLATKTHKRVRGVHIEKMCREAVEAAKQSGQP